MQSSRTLLGGVALLAAVAGAYALGRSSTSSRATQEAPAPAAADLAQVQRELDAVLASQVELRAQVASLQGAVRAAPPPSAQASAAPPPAYPSAAPPPPAPRSVEAVAAEDSAHAILDDALRAGRWTNQDRDRMREALAAGDDETRQTIFREFSVAVNSRRLAFDGLQGPPL